MITREMLDKGIEMLARAREQSRLPESIGMTKAEYDRFVAEHRDEIEDLAEMLGFPPLGE